MSSLTSVGVTAFFSAAGQVRYKQVVSRQGHFGTIGRKSRVRLLAAVGELLQALRLQVIDKILPLWSDGNAFYLIAISIWVSSGPS
jgi:hypothetical protein